jgi:hypothetical protein|tara:strand:- start:5779 stop:5880 length:102 start_codon:yes stop_codon:yes gene_type:complete
VLDETNLTGAVVDIVRDKVCIDASYPTIEIVED